MPDSERRDSGPIGDIASPNGDGQEPERRHVEFSRRLQAAAKAKGLGAPELARRRNLSRGTFSRYWTGERIPPGELLFEIADDVGVDARFLVTGAQAAVAPRGVSDRGQKWKGPIQRPERDDLVEVAEIDPRFGLGNAFMDEAAVPAMRTFSREWLRQITPTPAEELYWARGRGDSMSPTIRDGEPVLIDTRQNTVLDADLVWAFAWGDIGAIKRLRPMPDGTVKILSDNPSVDPDVAKAEEIHIFGRVVHVVKRV